MKSFAKTASHVSILGALAAGLVFRAAGAAGADIPVIEVQAKPFTHALELDAPSQLIEVDGQYLVLDVNHHRVLRLDRELEIRREIGGIGQGKGQLYYPIGMGVDQRRNIYVLEFGNNRVQVFDWDGNFRNEFAVPPRPTGFAVSPAGEVYVGGALTGKLVSVYGPRGEPRGGFGELKRLSDFYGKQFEDRDQEYERAINRCLIAVHRDGGVLVAFVGAPFLQKYDANRKLVFEKKLEGPQSEGIFAMYAKEGKSPARRGYDSVPTPLIVTGLGSHPATGDIYVAFTWIHSWLHVSDASGRGKAVLEFSGGDVYLNSPSVSEDGRDLLAPKFGFVQKETALYRIRLPTIP